MWILLKQETVSGSGISWAVCKSTSHSRQITTPAPHHSVFYRPDALLATQPTASKHWRPGLGKFKKNRQLSRIFQEMWKQCHLCQVCNWVSEWVVTWAVTMCLGRNWTARHRNALLQTSLSLVVVTSEHRVLTAFVSWLSVNTVLQCIAHIASIMPTPH